MLIAVRAPGSLVVIRGEVTVTSDEPAEVAAPVRGVPEVRARGKASRADPVVTHREMGAATGALLVGDELPPALGQEAVVRAGDQPSAVRQRDRVRGLLRLPVRQHPGPHVAPVPSFPPGAVNL